MSMKNVMHHVSIETVIGIVDRVQSELEADTPGKL
jgi:hypothetical protein